MTKTGATGEALEELTASEMCIRDRLYEKGFLRKSSDDSAPEVAVGWRERKLNGKYEFKWLYVGKFAEGISEEASTKEENCHLQPRASRAVSTSVASTICMRYLLMNPTL